MQEFGRVERSPYYNVLVMTVEDPMALLEAIEKRTEERPALYDATSRVAPAMRGLEFHSTEEFKDKAWRVFDSDQNIPQAASISIDQREHQRSSDWEVL